MSEQTKTPALLDIAPDISHIITEDDEPVDNIFSAKQQRLLVDPLYSTTYLRRPFVADVNVGVFSAIRLPPLVPDRLLCLGVEIAVEWYAKEHRSYFIWEFGKPPDVVVEVVSNTEGGELVRKLARYALMHVDYYVVYDPQLLIQEDEVQVYELYAGEYLPRPDDILPRVKLGLTVWEGQFEEKLGHWLRWCDLEGNLLPTGAERAQQEAQRAEQAQERAEQAQERAEQAQERAERLAAKLRELGVDPDAD